MKDNDLDYLARTSADLRLLPGEYLLHEGEMRRAMFVLIDGRIEVTKIVDGIERVVGAREPGESFGELPLMFNAPFAVSFRAAVASRVLRVDTREFQVLAASAPNFSAAVTAAARERVGGLADIAAEPRVPPLAVIGPQFDNATHELREFLQRNSIEYDWLTPEAPGIYPQVRLRDGTLVDRPSIRDVAKAIGLCVAPARPAYDVAIIGGGPAGLAAAVYGASEGLSTVLFEREAPGGQAGTSSRIENYLGFPFGISGDDLAHRALEQAKRLGAEIVVARTVKGIDIDSRALVLDESVSVGAKAMIIAGGVSWRHLPIASLDRLRGRGVYYGAAPGEVKSVQGQDVYLVGGGNSAGQAALNFSTFARSVTLLIRGDSLAKSMSHYLIEQIKNKPNVRLETRSEVTEAYGGEHLDAIAIENAATGKTVRRETSALFVMIGADAETDWLSSPILRDEHGYVATGQDVVKAGTWPVDRDPYLLETSVPGIFAVGDVRSGSIKRVAAAVGEGSMAIALVHQYLAAR
ncbi:MAG TPA: FAD-dependent oxidoreductase [Candidatus Baltobacteraceae bacterium]|nr:FAD-dependent oxidoreductase [Candidatus Baltobacteraceae bacterium]